MNASVRAAPFSMRDLDRASALVGQFVPPTLQYAWPLLEQAVGGYVHHTAQPKGLELKAENDGVMVVGSSVLDAFDRLEVLEATAEAMIDSRPLGPLVPMSDAVIDELSQAFFGS